MKICEVCGKPQNEINILCDCACHPIPTMGQRRAAFDMILGHFTEQHELVLTKREKEIINLVFDMFRDYINAMEKKWRRDDA